MPITINGSGSLTGLSAGGLPDDCITTAEIAAAAVTTAKLGTSEASGLAKAWVNFNGTGTVAIRASFNVSSITDNGTGRYTVNFTTALVDANYVVTSTAAGDGYMAINSGAAYSTTAIAVYANNTSNVGVDQAFISVAIFR